MVAIELRLLFILGLLGLGGLAALTGALLSSLAERLSPSPRINRRRAGARRPHCASGRARTFARAGFKIVVRRAPHREIVRHDLKEI
jgi:hypothetical protein